MKWLFNVKGTVFAGMLFQHDGGGRWKERWLVQGRVDGTVSHSVASPAVYAAL